MTQQRRGWNVGISLRRIPNRTIDVAAAHDVDRYYVTPPTAAEIANAMQDDPGTSVNDSAHQDGYPPVQGPQQIVSAQIAQDQHPDVGERSWEIGCCGYYFTFGKRTSH